MGRASLSQRSLEDLALTMKMLVFKAKAKLRID